MKRLKKYHTESFDEFVITCKVEGDRLTLAVSNDLHQSVIIYKRGKNARLLHYKVRLGEEHLEQALRAACNFLKPKTSSIRVSPVTILPKNIVEDEKRERLLHMQELLVSAGFKESESEFVFVNAYPEPFDPRKDKDYSFLFEQTVPTYEQINKPRAFWTSKKMNKEMKVLYRAKIFEFYRNHGFPHVSTDDHRRTRAMHVLQGTDISGLIKKVDGKLVVSQNLTGLSLAWSFFPHAWDVKCSDKQTIISAFENDKDLKSLIKKMTKFDLVISHAKFMSRIKLLTGTQAVSNFRPTAAAALYDKFCPTGGTVYDMSAGWGGRMLGAFVSKNVKHYIATEPSTKTFEGLKEMKQFLIKHDLRRLDLKSKNPNKPPKRTKFFTLYKCGSEKVKLDPESVDFCFTSPPYFDCEQYADEDTQSYLKFPTYKKWRDGFLKKTFSNCYKALRPGHYMAINIANIRGKDDIEQDTVKMALAVGFEHSQTMYLSLSRQGKGFKFEPIFVFRKPLC